jgi:hypothetical protein
LHGREEGPLCVLEHEDRDEAAEELGLLYCKMTKRNSSSDDCECDCALLEEDFGRRVFPNFSSACSHYEFPGSFQWGSYGPKGTGIDRAYSNATPGKDRVLGEAGTRVLYRLKDEAVREQFLVNKRDRRAVRIFRKIAEDVVGVVDLGLFHVKGFVLAEDHVARFGSEFVDFVRVEEEAAGMAAGVEGMAADEESGAAGGEGGAADGVRRRKGGNPGDGDGGGAGGGGSSGGAMNAPAGGLSTSEDGDEEDEDDEEEEDEFFFSSPGDKHGVTGATDVVASDLQEDGRTFVYPHLHAALDLHLRGKHFRYWASKLAGRMQDIMNTGKQVYIYFQVKKGGSQVALHRVVKTFHSREVGVELWGRRDKSAVSLCVRVSA